MGGLALSRVGGFVVAGLITIDMLPSVFHASYWNIDSRIGIFARGVRCSI